MKTLSERRKVCFALLIGGLLLLGIWGATLKSRAQTGGQSVGGLQISIQLDPFATAPSKIPRFRVELRNTGQSDLTLNLGILLGNGRKQYPDAIVLILTDPVGKVRVFEAIGPPLVAGRIDPYVLCLPAGGTFSVPVNLSQYWVPASKEFAYKPQPGHYSIQAQYTGKQAEGINDFAMNKSLPYKFGFSAMNYWSGTVVSNRLEFEVTNP